MKNWAFIAVLVGLAVVWHLSQSRESFVPEFLDQGNVKRTAERGSSSYVQETNHFKPTLPQPEPIPGIETPFRVNMFTSFMPA
jgi:hypothetical protein